MRMADPVPTFKYLVTQLKELYPNFGYIHVIEPRVSGGETLSLSTSDSAESNDFIREIWAPLPLISAGAYTRESAIGAAEKGDLVAFGRLFTSNVSIDPISFCSKVLPDTYPHPSLI